MTTLAEFREAAAKKLDAFSLTSSSRERSAAYLNAAAIIRLMPIPEVKDGEVAQTVSDLRTARAGFQMEAKLSGKNAFDVANAGSLLERAAALLETLQAEREDARRRRAMREQFENKRTSLLLPVVLDGRYLSGWVTYACGEDYDTAIDAAIAAKGEGHEHR